MKWSLIEDGQIISTVESLPKIYEHSGIKYPIRRMWGAKRDSELKVLGWNLCQEITPDFDPLYQKVAETSTTILVDGTCVNTMDIVDLTDEESDEVLASLLLKAKVGVRNKTLKTMQELLPHVTNPGEMHVVKLILESVPGRHNTNLLSAISLYDDMEHKIAKINALTSISEYQDYMNQY